MYISVESSSSFPNKLYRSFHIVYLYYRNYNIYQSVKLSTQKENCTVLISLCVSYIVYHGKSSTQTIISSLCIWCSHWKIDWIYILDKNDFIFLTVKHNGVEYNIRELRIDSIKYKAKFQYFFSNRNNFVKVWLLGWLFVRWFFFRII